jgi:hypothetical protein
MTMIVFTTLHKDWQSTGNKLITILLRFFDFSTFILLSRCQEYGNEVLESPVVDVII